MTTWKQSAIAAIAISLSEAIQQERLGFHSTGDQRINKLAITYGVRREPLA